MGGADGPPQVSWLVSSPRRSHSPVPPCSALPGVLLGLAWLVPSRPCWTGAPQPLGPCQGWKCCPSCSSLALRPCTRGLRQLFPRKQPRGATAASALQSRGEHEKNQPEQETARPGGACAKWVEIYQERGKCVSPTSSKKNSG